MYIVPICTNYICIMNLFTHSFYNEICILCFQAKMFESSQAWLASTSSPMTCKFNIQTIYYRNMYAYYRLQYYIQ